MQNMALSQQLTLAQTQLTELESLTQKSIQLTTENVRLKHSL